MSRRSRPKLKFRVLLAFFLVTFVVGSYFNQLLFSEKQDGGTVTENTKCIEYSKIRAIAISEILGLLKGFKKTDAEKQKIIDEYILKVVARHKKDGYEVVMSPNTCKDRSQAIIIDDPNQ